MRVRSASYRIVGYVVVVGIRVAGIPQPIPVGVLLSGVRLSRTVVLKFTTAIGHKVITRRYQPFCIAGHRNPGRSQATRPNRCRYHKQTRPRQTRPCTYTCTCRSRRDSSQRSCRTSSHRDRRPLGNSSARRRENSNTPQCTGRTPTKFTIKGRCLYRRHCRRLPRCWRKPNRADMWIVLRTRRCRSSVAVWRALPPNLRLCIPNFPWSPPDTDRTGSRATSWRRWRLGRTVRPGRTETERRVNKWRPTWKKIFKCLYLRWYWTWRNYLKRFWFLVVIALQESTLQHSNRILEISHPFKYNACFGRDHKFSHLADWSDWRPTWCWLIFEKGRFFDSWKVLMCLISVKTRTSSTSRQLVPFPVVPEGHPTHW